MHVFRSLLLTSVALGSFGATALANDYQAPKMFHDESAAAGSPAPAAVANKDRLLVEAPPLPTSEDTKPIKKSNKAKAAVLAKSDRALNTITDLVTDTSSAPEISLNAALREAYVQNPTLRAARAQVKATFEQLPQALSGWQPNVNADANVEYSSTDTEPGDGTDGIEKSASVSLTQPLYRGGRTIAGTRAAQATIDAQLATLATTERAVLYSTAQSYMDLLRDQATVRVNEKNRDVIARQLKATQDRFRVGDLTRTDVSQAEFRLAQAEADLTTSIGTLRSTRAVFEQLVGQPPGKLSLPLPDFKFPAGMDEASVMAETYNPDVIAAMARYQAAKEGIDLVYGELLPQVSLGAGLSKTYDPAGGTLDERGAGTIGITASMPLYEGGATRSRVREAKYTANQLSMKVIEARRAAREETVRAWENLNAARAELRSREVQVRAAEIARDGVRQEADLGERTILDALDADLEVRDAQIALISAKRNEVVAQFALASATGLLVPGNIGITEPVFDFAGYAAGMPGRILSLSVDPEAETGN